MDASEEKVILEAVQAGRTQQFEAVVRTYQRQAYRAALALVNDTHDAMDLAQDAFLRAFRAIHTFDTTKPFFPWLYRILRNLCLSHLKRRRRPLPLTRRGRDGEEVQVEVPDPGPGPARSAAHSEEVDHLYEVFQTLPEKDREILALRHFQGLAYAEIAEILDIPVGTVMSRLFYARRRLRDRMSESTP